MNGKRVRKLREKAKLIWNGLDKAYRDVIPLKTMERKVRDDYYADRGKRG